MEKATFNIANKANLNTGMPFILLMISKNLFIELFPMIDFVSSPSFFNFGTNESVLYLR